jgi:hypothetical protein
MANSLDRDIEEGEIVVLEKEYFKPQYHDLKYRIVKVMGGFGANGFTMGKALFVEFLCDGEKTRMEGYMISPKETEKYQAEHGKFVSHDRTPTH